MVLQVGVGSVEGDIIGDLVERIIPHRLFATTCKPGKCNKKGCGPNPRQSCVGL